MRRFIGVSLVLCTLWCLWWLIASAVMRAGIENWLAERRLEGWKAEIIDIAGGGFPDTLVATLAEPRLADPETGVAFSASDLTFEAKAWWPGDARVRLSQDTIRLGGPNGQADLVMADGIMSLKLAPGTALTLENLAWTAGPWGATTQAGSLVSADSLTLAMTQSGADETYRFDINAKSLRPGEIPRGRLSVPDHWPIAFDTLRLDMDVGFDRPWDLRSLEDRRPQPRRIDLRLAEAAWGTVRLNLAAGLDLDDRGYPTGDLAIQAENWRDLLVLAQGAGILPPDMAQRAEGVLSRFATFSGNPNSIDITLTFRDGRAMLGFVPLGPAPQIILP